jgi:glycerate kinase
VRAALELTADALGAAGIRQAYALTQLEPDERRCMRDVGPLMEELAGLLARDWLAQPSTPTPRA